MSRHAIDACVFLAISTGVIYVFAAVMISRFRSFGMEAKSIDAPTRWSAAAKPLVGGLIFFPVFVVGMLLWPSSNVFSQWIGILFSGTMAFTLGLLDDLFRLSARNKLIGQVLVACCLVLVGEVELKLLMPDFVLASTINFLLSVFLITGCMNSINMMDNMDAVSTVSALPVFIMAILIQPAYVGFELFFVAGLLTFLLFNHHPSRIFMGDSGSMILGMAVALVLIQTASNLFAYQPTRQAGWMIFGTTLFAVDTLVVVFNRIRHGVSPARGGRDHTSHNLVYSGFSQPQVMWLFVFLGIVQIAFFLSLYRTSKAWTHLTVAIVYFSLYLLSMLGITFRNLKKEKFSYKNESL